MTWDKNFNKGYHVEALNYYYSNEQCLLGTNGENGVSVNNIGEDGSNLTIAVLSMNRASLTIRLMDSVLLHIPRFAGEFLIGDNGSAKEELEKLYYKMEALPYRCRIVEFGINYGVAGGRNRLFKEAHTDWVLSADNDLYFVGNPLKKIQNDLSLLGCHFLSIPIVDKDTNGTGIYGGHLYVENLFNDIGIGGSSLYFAESVPLNIENPPFLCTFVPGGAAIMKKESFYSAGGFDESMFVGFEDVEFSVRLYQQGMKVGGCGIVSLIHDHPKPEIGVDINYEKKRFSTNKLKESAKYFEKKHGFTVWNFTSEEWVNKRHNELLVGDEKVVDMTGISRKKKKIALVIDRPEWALDNIAFQLIRYLSDEFDFIKIYQDTIDCLAAIFLMAEDCDVVHFLWRPIVTALEDDYTKQFIGNLGMTEEEFLKKFIRNKTVSVSVFDHLFLDANERGITYNLFTNKCSLVNSYTVSSEKLYKMYYEDDFIVKKPRNITSDGVDCELFQPINIERLAVLDNRTIKIGWAGNSKWKIEDLKGINTIIKPAVEEMRAEGYNVELITSDRNDKMIPHEDMPRFYAQLDVYVCASLCEGTPNPVLEAMACGIPIISTDVGIVGEAFGPKQKRYVLKNRTSKCLKESLEILLDNPRQLLELSAENLEYITKWDWTLKSEKYRTYFRECVLKNEYKI